MDPTPATSAARGLCIACNYPLKGLPEHRCPECGHVFDPGDPGTMNMGRPLSAASRWLLTPTGWPLLIMALSSLGGLLYLTDPRSLALRPSAVELRSCLLAPAALRQAFAGWPGSQKLFALAVAFSAAACVGYLPRVVLRWLVAIARRQWRYRPPDRRRKSAITCVALVACLVLIFYGYPLRTARLWARQQLAVPTARWGLVAAPLPVSHEQALAALERGVLYLETPRLRTAALGMLLRYQPGAVPAVLEKALVRERDPAVLARQALVLSLHRLMAHAPLVERLLDHEDSGVRAAAADGLGILHMPAFAIPAWGSGLGRAGAWIDADPPIEITPLLDRPNAPLRSAPDPSTAVPMPAHRWQRLRRMMLEAPTEHEREAAGRALLRWPPKNYRLRVAEWAVWRSDLLVSFELKHLAARPCPPFVHGNDSRLVYRPLMQPPLPERATKAAVFLETDHPIAVDVMVEMQYGRPRLAFPRPDQVLFDPVPAPLAGPPSPHGDLAALPRQYADFPWIKSVPGPAAGYHALPQIRWQSLIVAPGDPPPDLLPPVTSTEHLWFGHLRSASRSSLSIRGEFERILFYDGPTFAPSPIGLTRGPRGIELRQREVPVVPLLWSRAYAPDARVFSQPPQPRHGLLVNVVRGDVRVQSFPIPKGDGPVAVGRVDTHEGAGAIPFFNRLLTERGLSPRKAQSLIDTWVHDLFARDGERFVLLLSPADYNTLCPMRVTPAPTSLHRVGIIVTEIPPR